MKRSSFLLPTQKDDPASVEIASHRLMLKSGMIRQVAAGVYDILPLGQRALMKVETIVREEMNKAGALELLLPFVQPATLWQESQRWEGVGKELLKFQDRHERDFCLGPTHEEVVTELIRGTVNSYKELPLTVYQIQLKFRDEIRPRFGLMRAREFKMKDAYSFHDGEESLDETYQRMKQAYHAIFERCGLTFRCVEADSGNIGGSDSEEFMVLANSGEDLVVSTGSGSYAANIEKATSFENTDNLPAPKFTSLDTIDTPGAKTIMDVCNQLDLSPKETVKTLIFKADETFVALVLPGDREVNELALPSVLDALVVRPATQQEVASLTDIPFGSLGVIGLTDKVQGISRVVFDNLVHEGRPYCMGANEKEKHTVGAIAGKDFTCNPQVPIHLVQEGDLHIETGEELHMVRGIEVGHIFKLGTKYSQSMEAFFLNQDGKQEPFLMGCYGIGIGRTLASAIEQNHDDDGMILPPQLAPFEVVIVAIKYKDEQVQKACDDLYKELVGQGFDVLLDDRDASVGVKFKDADLIGAPVTIAIGAKSLADGKVEFKIRTQNNKELVSAEEVPSKIRECFESW